jgi:hypothetical protein
MVPLARSHIPSIMRGVGGTVRSVVTELLNPASGSSGGAGRRAHCHVKVLLLLYGLPRLLSGSIMAHELMHAWLRMEGVVGLPNKVEEGLCQLMACLWLDRQHELLKGVSGRGVRGDGLGRGYDDWRMDSNADCSMHGGWQHVQIYRLRVRAMGQDCGYGCPPPRMGTAELFVAMSRVVRLF